MARIVASRTDCSISCRVGRVPRIDRRRWHRYSQREAVMLAALAGLVVALGSGLAVAPVQVERAGLVAGREPAVVGVAEVAELVTVPGWRACWGRCRVPASTAQYPESSSRPS